MITNRWTNLAVKEAQKSEYYMRVGAVVFNKGKFISSGYNCACRSINKHHPKFRKFPNSIHAEVDAIVKAKKDLKGCSIIIVRINNKDQLRYSRPCNHCMSYLKHIGIRKIYYSLNEYPYIKMEKI